MNEEYYNMRANSNLHSNKPLQIRPDGQRVWCCPHCMEKNKPRVLAEQKARKYIDDLWASLNKTWDELVTMHQDEPVSDSFKTVLGDAADVIDDAKIRVRELLKMVIE